MESLETEILNNDAVTSILLIFGESKLNKSSLNQSKRVSATIFQTTPFSVILCITIFVTAYLVNKYIPYFLTLNYRIAVGLRLFIISIFSEAYPHIRQATVLFDFKNWLKKVSIEFFLRKRCFFYSQTTFFYWLIDFLKTIYGRILIKEIR